MKTRRVVDRFRRRRRFLDPQPGSNSMNNIIYIVGLVVIIIAILSFFGMR